MPPWRRVVFVFMVGTKEMGVLVLQRKLHLVVAWVRKRCVGCGLCCQKLGILLLFNGYVIFFFFLGKRRLVDHLSSVFVLIRS